MPEIRFRDAASVLRIARQIRGRDTGNVLRTFTRVRMRDENNVLQIVYQDFSVSIPASTYKSASGASSSGAVTSDSIAGTVLGGIGALTYLWKLYSGGGVVNNGGFTITTPNAAATTFSNPTVRDGNNKKSHYTLKVTDSTGASVTSDPIEVELEWIDTR
jgi:hypothetical protein